MATYKTTYLPATDYRGTSLRVLNCSTGKSRIIRWNYSVNGGVTQHGHAVMVASGIWEAERLVMVREWSRGWVFELG